MRYEKIYDILDRCYKNGIDKPFRHVKLNSYNRNV